MVLREMPQTAFFSAFRKLKASERLPCLGQPLRRPCGVGRAGRGQADCLSVDGGKGVFVVIFFRRSAVDKDLPDVRAV